MDQVKEYLQIAIKYRFWIVVGIAALLPVVAWFATSGAIAEEESKRTAEIKGAYEGVNKFANNPNPVNAQYAPAVEQKTQLLDADVKASWRKLYDRQAPLLTWPEEVADTIPVWGRKWPEGTDPNLVTQSVIRYTDTYLPYVEEVYQTFKPFNYETGEGIVAAPSMDALLRHPIFEPEKPPSLGKVWDTQQRLWVQRTVLDVVAKVNEKAGAKDWMMAPIKEILALEVASNAAQDQKSFAQGEVLAESPDVLSPAEEAEAEAEAAASESGGLGTGMEAMGPRGGMMEGMMAGAMMGGMSGGMSGGMGGGMMGFGAGNGPRPPQPFLIYESANPDQAFIVPIYLSVYIEQERIPDLLVEFQNSPMNIEILDFAYLKPQPHSVKKPEKGQQPMGFGGFGMMGMMMGGRGFMDMMEGGYGNQMMAGMMGEGFDPSMMMGQMRAGAMGGMGYMDAAGYGMGGMMGGVPKPKEGVNVVEKSKEKIAAANKKKKGEEEEDETKKAPTTESKIADPYFNVVKVEIYGRARFYMPPPEEEPSESESATVEAGAEGEAPAAEGETPVAAEGQPPAAVVEGEATAPDAATPPVAGETAAPAEAAAEPVAEAPKSEGETAPDQPGAEDQPKAGEEPKVESPQPEGDQPEAPEPAPGAESGEPAPAGDQGGPTR